MMSKKRNRRTSAAKTQTLQSEVPEARRPGVSRREVSIAGRRKKILEAARTLLTEGGADGLSMRKLAREAGVSVTTLYNLLGSREDILQALIDDSAPRFQPPAEARDPHASPLSRVLRRFERVVLLFSENAALARPLIVAQFGTGFWDELSSQLESFAELKTEVHEAFVEALQEGQLTRTINPGLAESLMYIGFQSALDGWAFGRVDDADLLDLSLCGAYMTLLAVAAPSARPELEKELRKVERRLRKRPSSQPMLPPSAYPK